MVCGGARLVTQPFAHSKCRWMDHATMARSCAFRTPCVHIAHFVCIQHAIRPLKRADCTWGVPIAHRVCGLHTSQTIALHLAFQVFAALESRGMPAASIRL